MKTLNLAGEERVFLKVKVAEDLVRSWRERLIFDFSNQNDATRESIVRWLLGDWKRLERLDPSQLRIAKQEMEYLYRILQHRYLEVEPEQAYRHLITRLGSLVLVRPKIHTWLNLSRDRALAVVDILQEVLQKLLQTNPYMQQQIAWIAECTEDGKLRNALLFADLEAYCLRPIRNQPLLIHQVVNYLRRT